jgi:hypothetical protein
MKIEHFVWWISMILVFYVVLLIYKWFYQIKSGMGNVEEKKAP